MQCPGGINAWRSDPRCTEVLTLGRLPPQPDQDTASGDQSGPSTNQPAPSTSSAASAPGTGSAPQPSTSSPQSSQPTEEELAQDAIGQKVLNATMCSATEVDGKTPPFNSSLRQVDLQFNQEYGYSTMEGVIRCLDYGELNGGFCSPPHTAKRACLQKKYCVSKGVHQHPPQKNGGQFYLSTFRLFIPHVETINSWELWSYQTIQGAV